VHFELDPRAPTPPSEQLADQVRFAVAAERLAPGDRLPSVRALAAEVRVNPNTVSRAWRELEREGVLEPRRGEGMFVAPNARAVCREAAGRVVAERLERAVSEARAAGLTPGEIEALVRHVLTGAQRKSA
jgi:GntR family transcriptional regulator